MSDKLTEEEQIKARKRLIRDLDHAIDMVLCDNPQQQNAGCEALERIKQMSEDYGVTDKNIVCDHFLHLWQDLNGKIESLITVIETMTCLDRNDILLIVIGLFSHQDMGHYKIYIKKNEKENDQLQQLLAKLKNVRQQYYILLEQLSAQFKSSNIDPMVFYAKKLSVDSK